MFPMQRSHRAAPPCALLQVHLSEQDDGLLCGHFVHDALEVLNSEHALYKTMTG